jgi:hypothetical protein
MFGQAVVVEEESLSVESWFIESCFIQVNSPQLIYLKELDVRESTKTRDWHSPFFYYPIRIRP